MLMQSFFRCRDTLQHYFRYEMMCGCGVPSITLTGTSEDWRNLRAKANGLKEFELDWWLDELLPVLDQFVAASNGQVDTAFWRSICMFRGASGSPGDPITGWLQTLFPYLNASGPRLVNRFEEVKDGVPKREMTRNLKLGNYKESIASKMTADNYVAKMAASVAARMGNYEWSASSGVGGGVEIQLIPPGVASAPFTYIDLITDTKYNMAFMGGVTVLLQNPDLSLEPRVGWAVVEKP